MKYFYLLFVIWILWPPLHAQTGEKLDSLVIYDELNNYASSKKVYQYDERGRDTMVRDFVYDMTEAQLQLLETLRISYPTKQLVRATYNAVDNQLTMRETTTFNEQGEEIVWLLETLNTEGELMPFSRILTTVRSPELLERDQYSWDGVAFTLSGRERTEYQSNGGYLKTTYRWQEGTFIPQQRTTLRNNEQSGLETYYLIENYYALSDLWAPFLEVETVLDIPNFSAYKLTEVADFDTGELLRFDSTTLYYYEDWTLAESWSYRPRGLEQNYVLIEQVSQYYTPSGNLEYREISAPNPADSTLALVRTDTYYYSDITIASTDETESGRSAVKLLFPNPSKRPQAYLIGDTIGKSYQLRVSDVSGQVLLQTSITCGESIDLNAHNKWMSGSYFLTLIGEDHMSTMTLIVP